MNRSWTVVGLCVAIATSACGEIDSTGPVLTVNVTPAVSSANIEAGIPRSANDLATLRAEVRACALDPDRGFGGYAQCPAYGELVAETAQHVDGFGAMMRWIEDDAATVRQAGAHALYVGFQDSDAFSDCGAMGRALSALGRESVPINSAALGGVVARFADTCSTYDQALRDRLEDPTRTQTLAREELIDGLTGAASARPVLFAALTSIAYDGQEPMSVRQAAIAACIRANSRPSQDDNRVAVSAF